MNKIYRLVFNKSLGVLQVTSELAKSAGKTSSKDSKVTVEPSIFQTLKYKKRINFCSLIAISACLASPAFAQYAGVAGGDGGYLAAGSAGVGAGGGGTGGSGGSGGASGYGGGGGGGGGVSSGGAGGGASFPLGGSYGGIGGTYGAPISSRGGDGANGYVGGGGGGGAAGARVAAGNSLDVTSTISGGAGGNGGNGSGQAGGGGGGGGVGVAVYASTLNNFGSIAGGAGGNGGTGSYAGGGGGGGAAVVITGGAGNEINNDSAHIKGGAGGSSIAGTGGNGGDGGAGVYIKGGSNTVNNRSGGYITGGKGGAGYIAGTGGTGGAGVYIKGGSNTVNNRSGGYITGGYSGGYFGNSGGNSGTGGAGVHITLGTNTVNNSSGGSITGGSGAYGVLGLGGAGVNISGGENYIHNGGSITGGSGGNGGSGQYGPIGQSGNGGAGVNITGGTNNTLTNYSGGLITGGAGGGVSGVFSGGPGGTGGAGISITDGTNTVINAGTISGGVGGAGGGVSGFYSGGSGGAGISITGGMNTVTNSGSIAGGNGGNGSLGVNGGANGAVGNGGAGILNSGTINTFTNTGSIVGGTGLLGQAPGINNAGTITTLNNAQGGDGLTAPKTALTFAGNLPTNYNIIVTSVSYYGQLFVTTPTGPGLIFGVDLSSVLGVNTYLNALTGLSSSFISNFSSISGSNWINFGHSYKWQLVGDAGCTTSCSSWDLSVAARSSTSNIVSGQTFTTANLVGGSGAQDVAPVFEGGTLVVSAPGSPGTVDVTNNFTVNNSGGTIDQNSQTSNFSGVISNATGNVGSMTIMNGGSGGSVTFSGINTYTGTTTVNTGATLALSGTGSIAASSGLVDNGTFDISATTGGASIKSLSGNGAVTLGAKSLSITNSADTFAGVVGGTGGLNITGGSQTLSGINTYTGTTTVNTGATLALSGTGSIAASSGLVDNGTFDISASTSGATINAISGSGAVILGAKSLTVANAAGNLSGVVGGTGGLNITGGSQTLSGANTFSGGVQVQSGAALSIASSNVLGSGALALIGSATVPATLNITDTTTIANAITVAGDPVFNITTGTTTTVSSPITNGGVAGDVVVAGGGTLNLTAVNTYTGLTNIAAGSTMALSGSGSITPSVSVTNNGTLNVASKTGNVALGGSFTQTSSGTLAMGFYPLVPKTNQQVNIAGAANLAGTLSLTAASGAYRSGRYTLLTAGSVVGTFGTFSSNLASLTRYNYALSYDAQDVYLNFISNPADTQQSLVNTSSALQNTYTLQNSVLANSFSYDCNVFGENDICVSAGGRNTAVSAANGLNNTSALLIAAYRLHPNYRVGAYADQNLSMSNAGSTVNLGNNTPLIGLFGVWSENLDGTGTEVKVAAAYGQKNTTVTRQVVGTSEPGSGSSTLNSQGAQVTVKYGFGVTPSVIISPYMGMRYTQNNMNGYTESTSATVTTPLTYSALNTNATTALVGVGTSYHFIPKATVFASAGVEADTNTANGIYSATGIAGLTPINFNANPVKTRPTATVGAYYDVEKNQRLGITGIYRQEPFRAVSTTSVMATYTIGF
jgi:hypothetical protein